MHLTKSNEIISSPGLPITAVFGAGGFIGRHTLAGLNRVNPHAVGISRQSNDGLPDFDLAAPDIRPLDLKKSGVTHAVIAAGVSGIAECERESVKTRAVNVAGTVELVRQLRDEGIRIIALSTDYVFDGADGDYGEESPANPLNEYGRQKADMERLLLESYGDGVLVVRLSKVFDTICGSGTLLEEMATTLQRGLPVRAAFDQYFCPTFINDVVAGIGYLLASDHTGVVHLCAPAKVNRLGLAMKLAHAFGCDRELVQKISLHDLGEPFARPLDTSMISTRFAGKWPFNFRSLDSCVKELKSAYGIMQKQQQLF